eukprot:maker-scaffold235_size242898-snap-gene-0.10 protein:Tk06553 transcript:maker-scaffold235_size242898-snap-gene-0.10-mRNA-1 annotation:"protein tag-52"
MGERHALSPVPGTPEWMAPLSRELEAVIAQRNLLTSRSRGRILRALSATAREGEDQTMEGLRARAVGELLQSEKSYLRHLEMIREHFMDPLQVKSWLSQADFVTVFGDIPAIIQVNKELLNSLERSTDKIGQVFLELAPYLKFYSTYAQEFQSGAKLVEKYCDKSRPFRQFIAEQESRPEVQLKLNALLITPVQRIPRYKMLLEDVIKNTPDCHPDKAHLQSALAQIDAVAWHINDQLRDHENSLKMVDIQKSLQGGCPKIIAPGRRLIRQGNLMKVPRAGGQAQPRYFVLFSDMIMYCKIKGNGVGPLLLPKTNALECGCLLPLKATKVETLVGRGVFKLTCQKEELILYSAEENSEEWIEDINQAAVQLKKDAATLRKESSRREPMKRPDLLKMRRDSLSQIMFNSTKPKATPRRLAFGASPKKKRPAPDTPKSKCESPSKVKKMTENDTPTKRMTRSAAKENASPDCALMMPPPNPGTSTPSSVQMRSKKVNRPAWKALSLTRKDKLKEEHSSNASALFRSPSIYDGSDEDRNPVMTTYLSGKICPLTPSQRQTDVAHLAQKEASPPSPEDLSRALVPVSLFPPSQSKKESKSHSFCALM